MNVGYKKLGPPLAMFLAAGLGACNGVSPPTVQVSTPFVPSEYTKYAATGSGRIEGQAFLRQNGGGVVTCAGSPVLLVPDTAFIREAISVARTGAVIGLGGAQLSIAPKDALKRSTCDAQGGFVFERVPAADWVVTTEVKWQVAGNQQGGTLLKNVSVKSGTSKVFLTDSDFAGR